MEPASAPPGPNSPRAAAGALSRDRTRRLRSALTAVGLVWATLAIAEVPRVECKAISAGGRVLIDPTLRDFFDRDLQRLIRLGLSGRVHIEVELFRRRKLWFDDRVDHRDVDLTLSWSNDHRSYYLQGSRVVDLAVVASERLALRRQSEPPAELEVHVSARLEVVTEKSLDTVATWMTGGNRSGIPSNLLKAMASDLVRDGSGSCPVREE